MVDLVDAATPYLKLGVHIVVFGAVEKDDGPHEANRINVGRDGITPPM